jgi:tRNA 2-thiouridine synthesizing protein A
MSALLSQTDLSALTADAVVDARGTVCPAPLLEAKKAMGELAVGDLLELWSSDPNTKVQLHAWAGNRGHESLGYLRAEGYDRVFVRHGD